MTGTVIFCLWKNVLLSELFASNSQCYFSVMYGIRTY